MLSVLAACGLPAARATPVLTRVLAANGTLTDARNVPMGKRHRIVEIVDAECAFVSGSLQPSAEVVPTAGAPAAAVALMHQMRLDGRASMFDTGFKRIAGCEGPQLLRDRRSGG